MKYIKSFTDTSAMNDFIENTIENGYYLLRDESKTGQDRINYVKINNRTEFCITSLENTSLRWYQYETGGMEYSLNGGDSWNDYTYNTSIYLSTDNKIYIRRKVDTSLDWNNQLRFIIDGSVNLSGNLYSLITSDYENLVDFSGWYSGVFLHTFWNQTSIINAKDLIINDVSLGSTEYAMFSECFSGCSNLKTSPKIKIKEVIDYWNGYATVSAYYKMFENCSQLNNIYCMTTNMTEKTVTDFTNGVAASGTFYKKAGTSWPTGTSGIPSGWTVIEVDE